MKTISIEKLILNAIVIIISDTGEANARADYEYLDSDGKTLKNDSKEIIIDKKTLDAFILKVTNQLGIAEPNVSVELAKPNAIAMKEGM
jgi:hypothetical protein